MSIKLKPIPTGKKPSACPVIKDVLPQNQIIGEILRIVISRSEDIAILKSLSDRKTNKLRVQTSYAEKTISEIDMKEEWRFSKEEALLIQLTGCKIEGLLQKKQLEKMTKKMIRINLQFEEEPNDIDMNLTEIHVQKIMSVKINSENTFISVNDRGQPIVNLPSLIINVSTWRESFSPIHKVLESCLLGDSLNPYNSLYLCVRQSRTLYTSEIIRQKQAIDEGLSLMSPNFAVLITSKRSRAALVPAKKGLSPIKKQNPLPDPDFLPLLLKMMMDLNQEVDKGIKAFANVFYERNSDENRVGRAKNPVLKALRARDYEKFSAVNPWEDKMYTLSTVKTLRSLHINPAVLFDLENRYFDENSNLADRVKVIHSCLVIQKLYKARRQKMIERKVMVIQRFTRGFLARKNLLWVKTQKFRAVFYWEKLKHWYPLLVNKLREKKIAFKAEDYSSYLSQIIKIQKLARGYLTRKGKAYWKKVFLRHRAKRLLAKMYKTKVSLWRISEKFEAEALSFTKSNKMANSNTDLRTQTGKEASKRTYNDMIFELEKSQELENRRKIWLEAKWARMQALVLDV